MDLLTGYGSDVSEGSDGPSQEAAGLSSKPAIASGGGGGIPAGFFDSSSAAADSNSAAEGGSAAGTRAGTSALGLPDRFFEDAPKQQEKASAKPASNGGGPSLVSKLSKLPAPKTGKGIVSFKVPIDVSKLAADDDDYQPKKKLKPSSAGMRLTDFLPAPKSESQLGAGSAKRLDSFVGGDSNGPAQRPKGTAGAAATAAGAVGGQQQQQEYCYSNEAFSASAMQGYGGSSAGGDTYGPSAYPPSDQYGPCAYPPPDAGAGAAAGAYQYASAAQYGAYGAVQDPYGGQYYQDGTPGSAAGPSSVGGGPTDLLGVALAAEQDKARRRGRGGGGALAGIKIKEVSQQQLVHQHPGAKAEAQGLSTALGPGYVAQLRKEAGPAPDKMAKRKHQISTLYHQSKLKEVEMLEKRGTGFKSKAETQAKYGWS